MMRSIELYGTEVAPAIHKELGRRTGTSAAIAGSAG
jgi:hypothetical protein